MLFRSITPLHKWTADPTQALLQIEGSHRNEIFKVKIICSDGWAQSRDRLVEHWSDVEICRQQKLRETLETIGDPRWFLIIDNLAEVETPGIHANTIAAVEVWQAAVDALLIHLGGTAPYITQSWTLTSPGQLISEQHSNVSMNMFRCTQRHLLEQQYAAFEATFRQLVAPHWIGSQFEQVLHLARGFLEGALRTLNERHAFALLAVAFETLFCEKEGEFSKGCVQGARLLGRTKGECSDLQKKLNEGSGGVRELRNAVLHGELVLDDAVLATRRVELANLISQALVDLMKHFATVGPNVGYYNELNHLVANRFKGLPVK